VTDLVSRLLESIGETERLARAANVKQDDPEWRVHDVALSNPRMFRVRSAQDHRPIAQVQDLGDDEDTGDLDSPPGPTAILDGRAAAAHIALHDPSSVLRRCAADRRVFERHGKPDTWCAFCDNPWPCEDFRDLADRYGLEVTE
jgi:hypothetical protein